MVASKQGVVAVCQASQGASLEVPFGSLEGLNYDSIGGPLWLGRTLQAQGSRKPSHPIRLGQYKGFRVLVRSVVLNHHLSISNNLRSISAFVLSFNSGQPIALPTNFDYDHCHLTATAIHLQF